MQDLWQQMVHKIRTNIDSIIIGMSIEKRLQKEATKSGGQ
jgi:hypothetical protein